MHYLVILFFLPFFVLLWAAWYIPHLFWYWVFQLPMHPLRRIAISFSGWLLVGLYFLIDAWVAHVDANISKAFLGKPLHALADLWHDAGASIIDSVNGGMAWVIAGGLTHYFLVSVLGCLVVPLVLSTVFLGPVHLFVLAFIGYRPPRSMPKVGGRQFKADIAARPKNRKPAEKRRQWYLGTSQSDKSPVYLGRDARLMHTWVVGGTGTGKTTGVLLPAIRADLLMGRPIIILDGKAERSTIETVYQLALDAGRGSDFQFFDMRRPSESLTYSPLIHGSANEQCDKILASLRWESEYYRAQSATALLRVLRGLKDTGKAYSLDDIYCAVASAPALRALMELTSDDEIQDDLRALVDGWKALQLDTSGLRVQLEMLLKTDFGPLLKSPHPQLDLLSAYRNGRIVYIALPVARYPETAPLLAKLVMMDLNTVAGVIQDDGQVRTCPVVIDEFSSFAIPEFIDLLNKARSAGLALTVSHQSMTGDLAHAKPGFVQQLAANTSIKIVLAQPDSKDAQYAADLAGTYKTVKLTEQVDAGLLGQAYSGRGSEREVDEYVISPNVIRTLARGRAFVMQRHPDQWYDIVALDHIPAQTYGHQIQASASSLGQAGGINLRARARQVDSGDASPPLKVKPESVPVSPDPDSKDSLTGILRWDEFEKK